MKYKLDSKKYRKSDVEKYKNTSNKFADVEKYKNTSNEILHSERADLIEMSPDFDFCMKRLDVSMHILDSR